MGRKHKGKIMLCVAAALIIAGAGNVAGAYAPHDTDAGYIVKYKENAAEPTEDGSLPFDVVSEREMRRLNELGLLEWYEPDGTAALMDSPYYESEQWNLEVVGAQAAFEKGALGQGIRVGVLDSGITPTEEFGARLLPGYNYMEDAADAADTSDRLGHGTGVAGLIAGAGENGYIGIAPAAELVPLKVTDGESVMVSAICRAIYGGVDDFDCDVLNLSLGVNRDYESLREAVDYAAENGVVVVAAVGNDGTSTVYYPAGYDSVIGVGAVNRMGNHYSRSNHNSSVFCAAPGVNVRSTANFDGYQSCSGTSFSVAQVSGGAAALLSIDPSLTPARIMELMAETAYDRGEEGYDEYYGHGILNIAGCVGAVTGGAVTQSEPLSGQGTQPPSEPEPRPKIKAGYRDCPKDDVCVMAAYADLDRSAWYHDGVHFALENQIMNGVGERIFSPSSPTNRAMLVAMLWRMEGAPTVNHVMTFADVPTETWYAEAVRWAASEHIADGYSAERFAPDDNVSREQLTTILWRYAKHKGAGKIPEEKIALGVYVDAEHISGWACDAMRWAVNTGLITGLGGEKLSPETDASRAQVATMLLRYYAFA